METPKWTVGLRIHTKLVGPNAFYFMLENTQEIYFHHSSRNSTFGISPIVEMPNAVNSKFR